MTLASLALLIIRDISDIRGQILQPRMSLMSRIMGTEPMTYGTGRQRIALMSALKSTSVCFGSQNSTANSVYGLQLIWGE